MTNTKIQNNGYTFKDLTIIPRLPKMHHNEIQTDIRLFPGLNLTKPFLSSPMDTVTDSRTAIKLALNGAVGVLHYHYEKQQLLNEIKRIKNYQIPEGRDALSMQKSLPVGVLVRCEPKQLDGIEEIIALGVDFLAIDSLHTSPHKHVDMVRTLRRNFPDTAILSGNVVHPEDCLTLIDAGVSMLRIGYSAASINEGNAIFGTGRSQANAIYECAKIAKERSIPVIADGGLKSSGDIALAFALGADCVMLGRLFAASYDTPGTIVCDEYGSKKKLYQGMSRSGFIDKDMISEGSKVYLDADSSIIDILNDLHLHLKMSIARAGAVSLKDFYENSELQLLSERAINEMGIQ